MCSYRDPTADELVQRLRLTSTSSLKNTSPKRPSLTIVKRGNSVIRSADTQFAVAYSLSRNCVSSLHQNVRGALLYGKNNVTVNDGTEMLKGYLSLHQESNRTLTVKWMPNQLMHSCSQPTSSPVSPDSEDPQIWRHTIVINLTSIIYIHLHQQADRVSLVFVDTDGVQYAPFEFPPGQHCVTFLASLESALSPLYRLDPPLWTEPGKGKVLPELRKRRGSLLRQSIDSEESAESPEAHDYVFRIRKLNGPPFTAPIVPSNVLEEFANSQSSSMPNSPALLKKKHTTPQRIPKAENPGPSGLSEKNVIMDACRSMRHQILSRAFFGWLSYCRHMKTIRTHLSATVTGIRFEEDDDQTFGPVDSEFWLECRKLRTKEKHKEFLKRCYLGGIDAELRKDCWPYLVGLIPWDREKQEFIPQWTETYRRDCDDWAITEAEVIRRDTEQFRNARLRQSSNSEDFKFPPIRDKSMSCDVFENGNGENYETSNERLIEDFGTNLHRIEKDVERCDRHTPFFSDKDHLMSLKRIMCTYVWRHLSEGYVQGMCDIAGPILVIFNDEVLTLECFETMMLKMKDNFPKNAKLDGSRRMDDGIDNHLNNLRSIVQVMDAEIYQQLMSDTDCTHLYFAYRWFLLDFKRELTYPDVFLTWEVIWAASQTVSEKFQLFIALALLSQYREVLLEHNMDFTDVIKFYNEMAEKHEVKALLKIARNKLRTLQELTNLSVTHGEPN